MNTANIIYKFKEFKNCLVEELRLKEEVGGKLAEGYLRCSLNPEDRSKDYTELNCSILINSLIEIRFKAYVTDTKLQDSKDLVEFKFNFVDPEFYTNLVTKEYRGLNQVVKSCYSGLITLTKGAELVSDSGLDNLNVYQNGTTKYTYLTEVLLSFHKDIFPTYRFDSLHLVDLSKDPEKEINLPIFDGKLELSTKKVKYRTMSPRSGDDKSVKNNLINYRLGNEVNIVHKNFKKAAMNKSQNSVFLQSLLHSFSLSFPEYMEMRAGDLVKYISTKYEVQRFLVVSSELVFKGSITHNLTFKSYEVSNRISRKSN